MTYAEMLADLLVITARPDLLDDSAVALRRSTLRMHGLEFWKFDLTATRLAVVTPSLAMTINTETALTRFRQICFIKASDTTLVDPLSSLNGSTALPFYDPADANRMIDNYGRNLQNVYYTMGRTINIKSNNAPNELFVGYYQRPIISPVASYDSWIAEEYPYAIIDDAAAFIFQTIGKEDKVKKYSANVVEHIQIMKTNYLEEQSR